MNKPAKVITHSLLLTALIFGVALQTGCASKGFVRQSVEASNETSSNRIAMLEAELKETQAAFAQLVEDSEKHRAEVSNQVSTATRSLNEKTTELNRTITTEVATAADLIGKNLSNDVNDIRTNLANFRQFADQLRTISKELATIKTDNERLFAELERTNTSLRARIAEEASRNENQSNELRTQLTRELARTQKVMQDNTERMVKALDAQRNAMARITQEMTGIVTEVSTTLETNRTVDQ